MNNRSVIGRSNHVTEGKSVVGQLPVKLSAAAITKQNKHHPGSQGCWCGQYIGKWTTNV